MTENELAIQPGKLRRIDSGTKLYTIRRGHRTFDKNIRVFSGAESRTCIVNAYTHTVLSEVPFFVFESEGFQSFQEVLDTLSKFYSEVNQYTEVTIVEFRLAL